MVKCKSYTKAGKPCKAHASNKDGRCLFHTTQRAYYAQPVRRKTVTRRSRKR